MIRTFIFMIKLSCFFVLALILGNLIPLKNESLSDKIKSSLSSIKEWSLTQYNQEFQEKAAYEIREVAEPVLEETERAKLKKLIQDLNRNH